MLEVSVAKPLMGVYGSEGQPKEGFPHSWDDLFAASVSEVRRAGLGEDRPVWRN